MDANKQKQLPYIFQTISNVSRRLEFGATAAPFALSFIYNSHIKYIRIRAPVTHSRLPTQNNGPAAASQRCCYRWKCRRYISNAARWAPDVHDWHSSRSNITKIFPPKKELTKTSWCRCRQMRPIPLPGRALLMMTLYRRDGPSWFLSDRLRYTCT